MPTKLDSDIEHKLGVGGGRLWRAYQELENFELGTEAFRKRCEELAQVLTDEAIATDSRDLSGERLVTERRLFEALFELCFIAQQPIPFFQKKQSVQTSTRFDSSSDKPNSLTLAFNALQEARTEFFQRLADFKVLAQTAPVDSASEKFGYQNRALVEALVNFVNERHSKLPSGEQSRYP